MTKCENSMHFQCHFLEEKPAGHWGAHMGECSEVKIWEVQGIQKSRRLAVRENQQGLGRGNTLEPNGKDEQVSTRRRRKIQVLLVEKKHVQNQRGIQVLALSGQRQVALCGQRIAYKSQRKKIKLLRRPWVLLWRSLYDVWWDWKFILYTICNHREF